MTSPATISPVAADAVPLPAGPADGPRQEARQRRHRLRPGAWAQAPHLSAADRRSAMEALMLRPSPGSLRRFATLMGLSVVVAAMGLLQDSTAVVVGAMVIAPLMAPIMGIAASLVMGWGRRLVNGVAVVATSVVAAIGMAWGIALLLPQAGTSLPHEVLARSSPDVRDLLVALAAGTAGAYATVRRDISGALPGVAVAVALVPPLSTVGILLGRGQPNLAAGAGLLFATNLFAIILAAALVFLGTGFVPRHRLRLRRHHTVGVITAILAPTLAIAAVLTFRFLATTSQADDLRRATQVVQGWMQPGDDLNRVSLDGGSLQINISGQQSPADLEPLTEALRSTLGRQITVDLRWTPTHTGPETVATDPPVALDMARPVIEEWLTAQELVLDGLSYESGSLLVRTSGPQPPHDSQDLTEQLATTLGVPIPVSLAWTRTSAGMPAPETDATTARTVTETWLQTLPGTRLLAVVQTADGITVTLTGQAQPDVGGLRDALTTALPQASITIGWVPGSILDQTSPTPQAPNLPSSPRR